MNSLSVIVRLGGAMVASAIGMAVIAIAASPVVSMAQVIMG